MATRWTAKGDGRAWAGGDETTKTTMGERWAAAASMSAGKDEWAMMMMMGRAGDGGRAAMAGGRDDEGEAGGR